MLLSCHLYSTLLILIDQLPNLQVKWENLAEKQNTFVATSAEVTPNGGDKYGNPGPKMAERFGLTSWWFQIFFVFTLLGYMIQFD